MNYPIFTERAKRREREKKERGKERNKPVRKF
jgi:hypothetical protein